MGSGRDKWVVEIFILVHQSNFSPSPLERGWGEVFITANFNNSCNSCLNARLDDQSDRASAGQACQKFVLLLLCKLLCDHN